MVATLSRADRVVLHNISWEQFERLLEDLGDHRAARIAYDNGTLEIMTPLPEHEYFKETIGDAVKDIAEELEIDYESYGSTTWRKQVKFIDVYRTDKGLKARSEVIDHALRFLKFIPLRFFWIPNSLICQRILRQCLSKSERSQSKE